VAGQIEGLPIEYLARDRKYLKGRVESQKPREIRRDFRQQSLAPHPAKTTSGKDVLERVPIRELVTQSSGVLVQSRKR